MSNTIVSSVKTLLIDRVKNSSPVKGAISRSGRVICQCKNLFVISSFNIKNSVKKLLLKQRKINVSHYATMHASINILHHEIKELKRSLPIHLSNLKNKIGHEIDSKLIIKNENKFNLLHDKLDEISSEIHAQSDKINKLNNDIKNIFSVYKKVVEKYFYCPDVNVQTIYEKSASQLIQLRNNSPRVPSDSRLRELTADPQLPQLESGPQLKQLTAGPQLLQLEAGPQLPQLTAGPQLPQLESGPQLPPLTAGPQLLQLESGPQLPQLTAGPQLPQLESGPQLKQLTAGPQLPQLEAGLQLPQLTAGPQLLQLESGPQLLQLTEDPELVKIKIDAELGANLPNYGDSEAEIATDQQRRYAKAEARANAILGQQLPNYGDGEAEIAADQQRRIAQAEAKVNAELGRQLPNYDDNEIARATTISDLEGTDLSPEMTPAKKLSVLQEIGRKIMQDPKSSLAARTAAFHRVAQAHRELKFSKKRIYRKN